MDSTGKNPKDNGENNEEDDLLWDLTQEYERRGDPPFIKKLEKNLQYLLRGVFKKKKNEKVVMDKTKFPTKQNLLTLDFKKSKN